MESKEKTIAINATYSTQFPEKWIHFTFFLLASPLIWTLSRYITPSEIIILAMFCIIMCSYFHVLFHQKISCVHNVQIQVLTSIRDMLSQKLSTTKVIYIAKEEDDEEGSNSDENGDKRCYYDELPEGKYIEKDIPNIMYCEN